MIQEIIVFVIVAAALGLTGRSMYKKFKAKGQIGCGCTGCDQDCDCGSNR